MISLSNYQITPQVSFFLSLKRIILCCGFWRKRRIVGSILTTNCEFYFGFPMKMMNFVIYFWFLMKIMNSLFYFFDIIWISKVISGYFLLQKLLKKLSFCQNDKFCVMFYDCHPCEVDMLGKLYCPPSNLINTVIVGRWICLSILWNICSVFLEILRIYYAASVMYFFKFHSKGGIYLLTVSGAHS